MGNYVNPIVIEIVELCDNIYLEKASYMVFTCAFAAYSQKSIGIFCDWGTTFIIQKLTDTMTDGGVDESGMTSRPVANNGSNGERYRC